MGQRVIASVEKQPRGLTRADDDVPSGCLGALRLAMTPRHPTSVFPAQAGTQTCGAPTAG